MDLHYKQEATVGALVLVAVVLFIAGTMWLSGRSLRPGGGKLLVQFENVGTLKRGNPVKVSGVTLGSVAAIDFEEFGKVMVELELSNRITPKLDASAKLVSIGLVGDMQVELNPGSAVEPLPAGRVLIGTQDQGLTALGMDLGNQAQDLMAGVQELANKRLADDLHETLKAMQRMMNLYGDTTRGPTAEIGPTMRSLQRLSERLDSTLSNPDLERLLAHADTATARLTNLTDQFTTTSARLDTLLTKMNSGDGTMGRLVSDSTLYVEITETSRSLRKFLDELTKNPGKITVQVKFF